MPSARQPPTDVPFNRESALALDVGRFPEDGPGGRVREIAAGASGRMFFRIQRGGRSRVLAHYPSEPEENRLFAEIGRALRGADISVPEILADDPVRRLVWLEDLGDRDLFALLPETEVRRGAYRRAVEVLVRIQSLPDSFFRERAVRTLSPFDEDLYNFEQHYFARELVERLRPWAEIPGAVRWEWRVIRASLQAGPTTWVHRDFQSKNLMLDERANLRVVDFQGIRRGHRFYDLASLLCDPYADLPDYEREELLALYAKLSPVPAGDDRVLFATACCQRMMQALGAYGKFGLGAGVPFFRSKIGPALRLLGESARRAGFPALAALAGSLADFPGEASPAPPSRTD